jgi:hypothetical protein
MKQRRHTESCRVLRGRRFFHRAQPSLQIVIVATVGIHERERSESFGGPPGSRSRHLESVARMSRDVAQCPNLVAGRRGTSANIH